MDVIERDRYLVCRDLSVPEGLQATYDCEDLSRGGEVLLLRSLVVDREADLEDGELEQSEPDDEHNEGSDAIELDIEL